MQMGEKDVDIWMIQNMVLSKPLVCPWVPLQCTTARKDLCFMETTNESVYIMDIGLVTSQNANVSEINISIPKVKFTLDCYQVSCMV